MSEASQSALRYVAETTPGTTPANPAFQELAYVSSGLAYNPATVTDDSISSDRQVLDVSLVSYDVSGDNVHRMRYGALDDMFEASFYSSWNKRPNLSVTTFASSTGTFNVAAGGVTFLVGHLVLAKNFAQTSVNAARRVTSSTGTTVVVGSYGADTTTGQIQVVGAEGVSGDIAAVADGLTTSALNFINLGFVAGMWVKIGGSAVGSQFNTTANNDFARISVVTGTKLTFDSVPTGWTADAGTGKTIRVFMGDYLRNGTLRKSFTFEREYKKDDGSSQYRYFKGVFLGMTLDLSARDMIGVTFSAMGINSTPIVTTRFAGSTSLPSIIGEVMNSSSNLGTFRLGGVPLAAPNFILGASLDVNNNHRGREAVGTPAFVDIRSGRFEMTGSVQSYLGDAAMLNALYTNTATGLALPMLASDRTSGYHFDVPRLKFSDGNESVDGNDEDIAPELSFQALKHPTLLYTGQLSRYAYLEF